MPLINTGDSIQTAVNANPNGTSFCLASGVHEFGSGKPNTTSIAPKVGNIFTGQFGAILDGAAWSSSDLDDAFFRAVDNGITGVSIRNLEIRDGPCYGVNAYRSSSAWVVEYNNIHGNRNGVSVGKDSTIQHNNIHHNIGVFNDANPALRGGGYALNGATNLQFLHNEIAYNGQEQKAIYAASAEYNRNLYVAHNWFHHNVENAWWIDGDGEGSIVENNLFEDNSGSGCVLEKGKSIIARDNTSRRNTLDGIYISETRDSQIYRNTLEGNAIGMDLFLDCADIGTTLFSLGWSIDMIDNTIHDNIITVPVGPSTYGSAFTILFPAVCSAPYIANSKNNNFDNNTYTVVGTSFHYWLWPSGSKSWLQWQALPQDVHSTLIVI